MGYAVGFDEEGTETRFIGYGVPGTCDHPGCGAQINRGMAYRCLGKDPMDGLSDEEYEAIDADVDRYEELQAQRVPCGRYFCPEHGAEGTCARCATGQPPFDPTPDTPEWIQHVLTDPSWQTWRTKNPDWTEQLRQAVPGTPGHVACRCGHADDRHDPDTGHCDRPGCTCINPAMIETRSPALSEGPRS